MSTNFYWVPQEPVDWPSIPDVLLPTRQKVVPTAPSIDEHSIHIGKQFYGGSGSYLTFTFAIEPQVLLDTISFWKHEDDTKVIAKSEYGDELTAIDLEVMILDCMIWQRYSIGRRFC